MYAFFRGAIVMSRQIFAAAFVLFTITACTGSNGRDGQPCTVVDNQDGSATITCPDGSTTRVTSGTDGTNGTNGMNGSNGMNGMNGTSCSVASDGGTTVISCADGTQVTLPGTQTTPAFAVDFSKLTAAELQQDDFAVTVQSVSNAPRPVVRFTVKNLKGVGMRNIPPNYVAGISLLQLVPGTPTMAGNGLGLDTWVSHIANCATCVSTTETANANTLVDNGDGTYVYTFAKDVVNPTAYDGGMAVAGVAFDANAVHRFAMRFADPANDAEGNKANAFRPVDVTYDYIPATGANVDGQNDKVNASNCLTCHTQWRAGALNVGGLVPFHGGQRYDVRYCVVCHNDQRKYSGNNIAGNAVIAEPTIDMNNNMTPPAGRSSVSVLRGEAVINLPVFIHKIHAGEFLKLKGKYAGMGTEINEFNFPQDLRNCTKCHSKAAKADNWMQKPSRRACGSCHDNVNFATGQGHGPLNLQMQNDNVCNLCHDPAFVTSRHLPVVKPDPANSLVKPGGSNNTHASWLGNPSNAPDGGRAISYELASVTTTDGGTTGVFPVVRFRFKENDAGVVFNAPTPGGEMLNDFVGSPSVYCVFSMPQDGISAPADFNASMSGYLKNIWAGTATGTGAGTLAGPDGQGFYTATLTGGRIPPNATQLTCGIGYSYSLSSALPLTQTNLPAYPYNSGNRSGGLSLPAPNVWKVATGYTGRRGATSSDNNTGQIVSRDRCENCHAQVGVAPSYHAGQRNDPATCAFCHTQNRTSSGWTAGSGSFIHAIHAAKKRTVPFNWHAVAATADHQWPTGFWGVDYPGRLNNCESCHNPGTYDFSAPWYTPANLERRTAQTVGTGTYDAVTQPTDGGENPLLLSRSPYVDVSGSTNYGAGYSYSLASQTVNEAAPTTLVISPTANNCFGCHDDDISRLHMQVNGASFYEERSVASIKVEQCQICHGPGRIAGIKAVHAK